jgi:hypothetical protein
MAVRRRYGSKKTSARRSTRARNSTRSRRSTRTTSRRVSGSQTIRIVLETPQANATRLPVSANQAGAGVSVKGPKL